MGFISKQIDFTSTEADSLINKEKHRCLFQDALKCIDPQQIQSLSIYTFVHNRALWKGFPDLFLWNPLAKKCKVINKRFNSIF